MLSARDKEVLLVMVLISLGSQLVLFWFVLPSNSGEKIPTAVILGLPIFYGLEVYVITRMALVYATTSTGGGFAYLRLGYSKPRVWLAAGLGGAIMAIGLIASYSLAFGRHFFPDRPSLIMGLGTGFVNLARE